MQKEDLKSRIFCPKISQLCCVMVTKHIFSVLYIHFISYFYMVIIQARRKLVKGGAALNCDENYDDPRVKKIYIRVNLKCLQPLPSSNIYTIMEYASCSTTGSNNVISFNLSNTQL